MSRILPKLQLLCRLQRSRVQCSLHGLRLDVNQLLIPEHCQHALEQQRNVSGGEKTTVSMKSLRQAKALSQRKGKLKPMNYSRDKLIKVKQQTTVSELADAAKISTDDVFDCLIHVKNGSQYDREDSVINDVTVIKSIMNRLGLPYIMVKNTAKGKQSTNEIEKYRQGPPDPKNLVQRPPVVTIMGHVDHGKTTLLDALRKTNVVAQEFGGITQHIGAFSVKLPTGNQITFLDTPGHAAFSAMRARGAMVTDIVILVVAGDDGVMPQTIESISHAQKARVPIVVAVNKMDKPEADLDRAKRTLLEYGIIVESFGGDVQAIPISAVKGENLMELQEAVITEAELLDLKGDPKGMVEGCVIESKVDPHRGKVATVLVQRGTLKKGSIVMAGDVWGKVKSMYNDKREVMKTALPSMPVEVLGWKGLPSAGDEVFEVKSEKIAQDIIQIRGNQKMVEKQLKDQEVISEKNREHREQRQILRNIKLEKGYRAYMQEKKNFVALPETPKGPSFPIIVKGDVDGSVEALLDIIFKFESKICQLDVIHYGVGHITQKDIETAKVFNGEVFGFNVDAPEAVIKLAEDENVPLHTHNVIYKLFDDLIDRMNQRLPLLEQEDVVGKAKVLQVFEVTNPNKKKCKVAGCRCIQGELQKKLSFKVERKGEIVFEGQLSSLKHHKEEVEKIKTDMECGLMLEDLVFDFEVGDELTCYSVKEIEQKIDWNPGF